MKKTSNWIWGKVWLLNISQHNKKEQDKTCSIHKLNTMKKHKKIECSSLKSVMNTLNGGQGWIRTTEVVDGRFTVCSLWPLGNLPIFNYKKMELVDGLEPPTCWLQISCSTNWATPASQRSIIITHQNEIVKCFLKLFLNFFWHFFKLLILRASCTKIKVVYWGGEWNKK